MFQTWSSLLQGKITDVTDVPADDNCLFSCLGLGTNRANHQIREEVVRCIRQTQNPDLVSAYEMYLPSDEQQLSKLTMSYFLEHDVISLICSNVQRA